MTLLLLLSFPNFIFCIMISSIEAGLKVFREEAFGTFQADNFEVQEMAVAYSWRPLLLKSSRVKRTAPTWLQVTKPSRPKPAGKVQAAEQKSPEQFEIFNII